MPELIYPTSIKAKGPFLISLDSLKQFDSILDEQMGALREYRARVIKKRVEQKLLQAKTTDPGELQALEERHRTILENDYELRESTTLELSLSDGGRLIVKSFSEAATHTEVSRTLATGFTIAMQCGGVSLSLDAESDDFNTDIKLRVSPSGSEAAKSLFSVVSRWLRSIRAPRWQQLWCKAGHLKFLVWSALIGILFLTLMFSSSDFDSRYYKKQGDDIVKQGVSPSNQLKAIETLLAIQSESPAPGPTRHIVGNWFWFLLTTGFVTCLILSYPPKLILGLGIGEDRIAAWRKWIQFVSVAIPGFVASNFLWPFVAENVKKLFH